MTLQSGRRRIIVVLLSACGLQGRSPRAATTISLRALTLLNSWAPLVIKTIGYLALWLKRLSLGHRGKPAFPVPLAVWIGGDVE